MLSTLLLTQLHRVPRERQGIGASRSSKKTQVHRYRHRISLQHIRMTMEVFCALCISSFTLGKTRRGHFRRLTWQLILGLQGELDKSQHGRHGRAVVVVRGIVWHNPIDLVEVAMNERCRRKNRGTSSDGALCTLPPLLGSSQ